jgi:hypothetical protein
MDCLKECNRVDGHAPGCERFDATAQVPSGGSKPLKHNRVPGDPGTSVLLPQAGGTVGADLKSDFYDVPASPSAGTPWCTLNLPGVVAGSTRPADGDEFEVSDSFNALGAGTTLTIVGRSGANGFQILDGGSAADSLTLNTAGAGRRLRFSLALGKWVSRAA